MYTAYCIRYTVYSMHFRFFPLPLQPQGASHIPDGGSRYVERSHYGTMDICGWFQNSAPVDGKTLAIVILIPVFFIGIPGWFPCPAPKLHHHPCRLTRSSQPLRASARCVQPPGFSGCSFSSCCLRKPWMQIMHHKSFPMFFFSRSFGDMYYRL